MGRINQCLILGQPRFFKTRQTAQKGAARTDTKLYPAAFHKKRIPPGVKSAVFIYPFIFKFRIRQAAFKTVFTLFPLPA